MTYNIQWYNTVQIDCHDSFRISSSDNTFFHQNNHKGTLKPRWKFPQIPEEELTRALVRPISPFVGGFELVARRSRERRKG